MPKVVIYGAGGFGKETFEILKQYNTKCNNYYEFIGFIDDNKKGNQILGSVDWFKDHMYVSCIVAVGDTRTRKKIIDKLLLKYPFVDFCNIIHPSVVLPSSVKLGRGIIVCANTVICPNVILGDFVHIDMLCSIGCNAVVEDYVRVSPNVSISDSVQLKKGCYIGCNSSIKQSIRVGDWSIIGMGSVVVKNIPGYVTAYGVPCEPKGEQKGEKC